MLTIETPNDINPANVTEYVNESESIPESSQGRESTNPHLSLESAEAMIMFRPDCYVHLLTPRPILFIHGEKDNVAHLEIIREIYRKARSPKRFVIFPQMDHIDLDRGEGLARQVRLSVIWFNRHLKQSNRIRGGAEGS